ncbi:hypothetical protein NDU88_004070 [Pleurodeles waltl]|uniref:Uncharacterized protein n=1 Tax=Pleurodeles waltl TaxID=8319 RepID=A0AAV7PBE2_PLEWA|nr:hypothetical protein NDU88_004070 [Pleurodeles waltl]
MGCPPRSERRNSAVAGMCALRGRPATRVSPRSPLLAAAHLSLPAQLPRPPTSGTADQGCGGGRRGGAPLRRPPPRHLPSPRGLRSRSQRRLLPSRSQHPLSEAAALKASGSAPASSGHPSHGCHVEFRLVGSR